MAVTKCSCDKAGVAFVSLRADRNRISPKHNGRTLFRVRRGVKSSASEFIVKSSISIGVVLSFFWLAAIGCPASAQSGTDDLGAWSRATPGGTYGNQNSDALPGFEASGGDEVLRHRDFTGKPCLAVSGSAVAHTIDPNLYDDVITAVNSCPQQIEVQVCYYQSEDCISMDIPGGETREAILGMLPSTQDFQFEFREKF
jgi:hypothetical protein